MSAATALDPFEFFFDKPWSDGLPVVTPTQARLDWMLAGTRRDAAEVVGPVPPAMNVATVRDVALHAVMAGCRPEYLPVVLGGLSLMAFSGQPGSANYWLFFACMAIHCLFYVPTISVTNTNLVAGRGFARVCANSNASPPGIPTSRILTAGLCFLASVRVLEASLASPTILT